MDTKKPKRKTDRQRIRALERQLERQAKELCKLSASIDSLWRSHNYHTDPGY